MRKTGVLLLLFLGMVLAQSASGILKRVEENLSTPWQAVIQGKIQTPSGEEALFARAYALPKENLFRVEFEKPASLEGNFVVITEKEVWNYLFLTNQLVISPKDKAQIQGLGFTPRGLGDVKDLAERVSFRLVGEVRLEEGPAWKLLGQAKEGQGFAQVELYVLKADPRPVRFVFLDEEGKVLAHLRVTSFNRAPLKPQALLRYPKDAQVVRR